MIPSKQFMGLYRNVLRSSSKRSMFDWTNVKGQYDLVVVGGGIVGMASAREIKLRHRHLKIAVLEKENKLACHQSGHNSGVIHAGIYYKPGSLKAKLCVEGLHLSYKYLDAKRIPYKKSGKLIVATNELEVQRLMDLYERGLANKVPDMQLVDEDKIQEIEPYCHGLKAIWSPQTGIVDWALVTESYGNDFKLAGGDVFINFKVKKFIETPTNAEYPITVVESDGETAVRTKYVLTCGGLQSDKLAELTGCQKSPSIVPFRGEYLLLSKNKQHMVRGNIYPVPDPVIPRLTVTYQYYQLYEIIVRKNRRPIAYTACIFNVVENLALVGLSLWTSIDNYEVHKTCFITFIATSECYMCMTYFINKNALRTTGKLSRTQETSLTLKRNLFVINVVSFFCAVYCFMRHNSHCEPGVYTLFALFEYIVVLTNMGFHLTSGYDFRDKWLILDATKGLYFTSTCSTLI